MLPIVSKYHVARFAGQAGYLITAKTSSPIALAARFIDHALVGTPSCLIASMPRISAGSGAQSGSS